MRNTSRCWTCSILASCLLASLALADGYRPDSRHADAFVESIDTANIVVFPTIVRDPYVARYSPASRDRIIASLARYNPVGVRPNDRRIDLGKLEGRGQFEFFQNSMRSIAEQLAGIDADYVMVLEVLFPPAAGKTLQVFGIHLYVLRPGGDNAFSFLLNSHHASFAAASLETRDGSSAGKEKLAIKATSVAMQALHEQIARARECAARQAGREPLQPVTDMVADFETGLVTGTSPGGLPLGFSTFSGPRSEVHIAVSSEHPPLPGRPVDNKVLRLDLDVDSWAGVLHSFTTDPPGEWLGYDWTGAKELSFWLYGNDSGTRLVIDVLDNRHRCSETDDAERYSFEFPDDFSGWKLIAIPFEVMTRKEIGNGAPNDGLNLTAVHGWGLAALKTPGKVSYFLDDVRLRRLPLLEDIPEHLSRDDVWVPVNDLPMYGGYPKTASQEAADKAFIESVLPLDGHDPEAAAERLARLGWNFYYQGDRATAIRRFNQAWLLHAENQNALWGFAVISRDRGKVDAALRYYALAIDQGAAEPKLIDEYEQLRRAVER